MAAEEMGKVRATPTITDTSTPMTKGDCSVAHMMREPTRAGGRADGGSNEQGQPHTEKMFTSGG